MDRVSGFAPSGSTDQFDPVQHRRRRKFLPEKELQLCQVRENFVQKIRITGVCNMVIRIAAWPSDVARNIASYRN